MNHKKIKKQIKKINSFFESITADDEISKIEKNLLLNYISKLYESVLDYDENIAPKPVKSQKPKKEASSPVQKKQDEPIPAPVRKPFERAETIEPAVETIPVQQVVEKVIEAEPIKETIIESVPAEIIETSKIELSGKMASIFEHTGGNELSDRLGNLPIKDLTKAMGINERMFTIKELFGGDQEKFKTVMSTINSLSGYEEAKEYLLNGVATELEWDSEENYKKADKFVKLVQRRFS